MTPHTKRQYEREIKTMQSRIFDNEHDMRQILNMRRTRAWVLISFGVVVGYLINQFI
jgi:hypothetical protein